MQLATAGSRQLRWRGPQLKAVLYGRVVGLEKATRERLFAALVERGWRLEEDTVFAPNGSMWLLRDNPWTGSLADMLERMRGRLARLSRFEWDDTEGWQQTVDDVAGLVQVLETLVGDESSA